MTATKKQTGTPLWVSALLDKSLSAVECRVLMLLCWRQGRNGTARPKQEGVASDLGLTCEGVRGIIGRLAIKGWVTVIRPARPGPGSRVEYQVHRPQNTPTTIGVNTPTAIGAQGAEYPNGQPDNTPTAKPRNIKKNTKGTHIRRSTRDKEFIPPTVDEVRDYATSRGHPDFNAQGFVDYYEAADWHDAGGNPVRNWKQKVLTWIKRDEHRRKASGEPVRDGYTEFGTHPATDEDIQRLQEAGVL